MGNDVDFCQDMTTWVPTFLVDDRNVSHAPTIVEGGQWPNDRYRVDGDLPDAVAMAIDCRGIINHPLVPEVITQNMIDESLGQTKIITFGPFGENNGPCWVDTDYGDTNVCAGAGIRQEVNRNYR